MSDASRYPLSWPFGWKRTPAAERKRTRFTGTSYDAALNYQRRRELTIADARDRLDAELTRLNARDPLLSTNVELTSYGEPRSGRKPPDDPGVAIYFRLGNKDRVLACDTWDTVAGNIAAIAAHIDCIRSIDRYGVGTLDQAFAGYDALPPPGTDNRPPWRKVLGLDERMAVSTTDVEAAYRSEAKRLHPDMPGGSHEGMAQLNLARDEALREIGA